MSDVVRCGQPGQHDYRVTVYPSRMRLALISFGALVFVVLGIVLCSGTLAGESGAPILVVGVAAIVFFGACLAFGVFRLVVRKPAVVLDANGLYDHASAINAGFLAWNEIETVLATEFNRQSMLAITVRDTEALLARMSGAKRPAMRANIKLNGAPVNIPQATLPIKVPELKREINRAARYYATEGRIADFLDRDDGPA